MRTLLVSLPVVGFVFATGAAGLIYEVVWQRYLHRLLGSDHTATALTLAVLLAGLSLGYALCGRLSARVRDPLRTYALLEAAIGAWALAFPGLFSAVERLSGGWSFRPPWLLAFQGVLVAAVLLVPPALLMGATVPFLTRIAAVRDASLTAVHALVYGVNTAGAVAGALAAGFWLVPALGLPGTLASTAWLNLAAGAFFFALSASGTVSAPLTDLPAERPATARFAPALLCAIVALSGIETMALENVLFRYASIVFGGSTLTFATVVAVFVAAIALGSLAVSRARRVPPWTLCAAQLVVAATLTAIFFTLDEWPYWAYLLRLGFGTTPVAFYFHHAAVLLALFVLFAVPVAALGAVLPLAFHELLPRVAGAGRAAGRLLSWNAAGSLAGSLAGGVVLYAWLDAAQVYLVVPLLACIGAVVSAGPLGKGVRIALGGGVAACAALLVLQPGHDANRLAIGTHRMHEPTPWAYRGADVFYDELYRNRLIRYREDGPLASVAVMETFEFPDDKHGSLSVLINGRSNSDTRLDAVTLRLSAHLAALWSAEPRRALVIGMGTGVTAGELTLYTGVERIDVAEISPTVVHALPQFAAHDRDVGRDERLRVHVEDARALLRRGARQWDLIVSEPSHLWVSGNDALFTREFYRLAGRALAEGGVFLQWVHLYDADIEVIGSVAHTLREEFPVIHAFEGTAHDLLLMATKLPLTQESIVRARERFERLPALRQSLAEIGIRSIDDLMGREMTEFALVFEPPRQYPVHTLDRPRLAFLAARAAFAGSIVDEADIAGRGDVDEALWELERMLREDGGAAAGH